MVDGDDGIDGYCTSATPPATLCIVKHNVSEMCPCFHFLRSEGSWRWRPMNRGWMCNCPPKCSTLDGGRHDGGQSFLTQTRDPDHCSVSASTVLSLTVRGMY